MDSLNVDEVKELSWVQCENEACLKWRRISREEVHKLGEESWFCHMNADTAHNKCQEPEENHRRTIHTANKCGYWYIFSQLPQGSLVWAKMPGHVRWPAILSPDPSDGRYVMVNDETGTPSQYHVEWLGQPHSHYWVHSNSIDIYGSSSYPPPHRKSKRKKSVFSASAYFHLKSDHYIKSLQASIQEADSLRSLTCEERLAKCVFVYKPQPEKDIKLEKRSVVGTQLDSAGKKKRGRPVKTKEKIRLPVSDSKTQSITKSKKKVSFSSQPHQLHSIHHGELSSSEDDSPAQQVPMLITSKEERLQADIQLLRRAEEKFERRLAKFASRHGIPLKSRGPQWQGRQVSRYQVYMAVQERGGYNMVSANRAWAKVYHEACGTSPGPHQSVSCAVKTFYTRNLLPYELYELRSSGSFADKAASCETQHKKQPRKHKKKHLKENIPHTFTSATANIVPTAAKWQANYHKYTSQPIQGQGNNFQPMGELGNICLPEIGKTPVRFEPMDDMGNFRLPIRGQTRVSSHPIGVQESSEGGHIGSHSQGEQCFKAAQGNTDDGVQADLDLLQEESTQALQELQAMQNMLTNIQQQGESTAVNDRDCIKTLDRPTHIEAEPYTSPLSRRKPVLLEFYSMQYGDEAECSVPDQQTTMVNTFVLHFYKQIKYGLFFKLFLCNKQKRVNDDTHLVPDITHPATTGNTLPSACPARPADDEGALCPDVCSNILIDMDAMGEEIDRLNDELCQDLMEI
ncbi:uncharacterized protein LOC119745225 [Patiria miniata]|uniref:CW-type domain-containing protein n=1 Tax=Patiria miniata TaxID=46514 RepID=A0A914BNU1_PATMI|nr:uncharacterized protein LOC119745225 [Patiria miniata]